jgi:uncharacterized membrane-anchored protein YitT (DUF2179 family)|tara:strand:- start:129720 stop:130643 length:924 start_codon:yes stop_codon:yes gene_type:complete
MKITQFVQVVSEYLQIGIGVLLASIGLKAFLLPNGFLDGGVTGIALLVSSQTSWDISILLMVFSIPFVVMGYFTLSKRIVVKSIIAISLLALLIKLESFNTITEDKLLIAIFGGLFLGMGIGLAIRNGAVLDGSEILGIFIYDRFGISIGKTILLFNIILFSVTAIFISLELAMYSILTYLVTAKVIDFIIEGFEDFIGLMIVSKHSAAVEHAIIHQIGVGMTIYKGESGYGNTGKQSETRIIHTVINRIDIRKLTKVLDTVDPDAFVIEFDINNVKGGVLRKYLDRKKSRSLDASLFITNEPNDAN